jgi:hypothetical protein
MNTQILKTAILGAMLVSALAPAALAKGGKDFYSQDYQFDQPMKATRVTRATTTVLPAPAEPGVYHRPAATSAARSRVGRSASIAIDRGYALGLPLRRPAEAPLIGGPRISAGARFFSRCLSVIFVPAARLGDRAFLLLTQVARQNFGH